MLDGGVWFAVRDGDARALALYLRHYSSAKARRGYRTVLLGNRARFVGAGEHIVLLTVDCRALFTWRRQVLRADGQAGIECTVFRNEGAGVSSELIAEAVAIASRRWPGERLFTFVDPSSVASPNPGYCFKLAGFRFCGRTLRGLHVLELLPAVGGLADDRLCGPWLPGGVSRRARGGDPRLATAHPRGTHRPELPDRQTVPVSRPGLRLRASRGPYVGAPPIPACVEARR